MSYNDSSNCSWGYVSPFPANSRLHVQTSSFFVMHRSCRVPEDHRAFVSMHFRGPAASPSGKTRTRASLPLAGCGGEGALVGNTRQLACMACQFLVEARKTIDSRCCPLSVQRSGLARVGAAVIQTSSIDQRCAMSTPIEAWNITVNSEHQAASAGRSEQPPCVPHRPTSSRASIRRFSPLFGA